MNQQSKLWPTVLAALTLVCICQLCGCTVIGLGMGALTDIGKPETDTVLLEASLKLQTGDEIRVILFDSSSVIGAYKLSAPLDSSVYAKRYMRFYREDSPTVESLKLGDTLVLYSKTGKLPFRYLFRGYGVGSLNVTVPTANESQIATLPFKQLAGLAKVDGVKLDLNVLEAMDKSGRLPHDLSVEVQDKDSIVNIPFDDIRSVEKRRSRSGWLYGMATGFAVDAIILITLAVTHPLSGGF